MLLMTVGQEISQMKTISNIYRLLLAAFLLLSCNILFAAPSASQYPPEIDFFKASPEFFLDGDSITLVWKTSHATQVHISGVGQVSPTGSRIIRNLNSNQGNLILTASNNGNFAPAVEKLIIQVAKKSSKTPPAFLTHLSSDKPILIIGNQTSLPKQLRKYKLKPVKHYTNTKPADLKKSTLPAAKKPMRSKASHIMVPQLNAPQIISPRNNSTFNHYPRTLTLRWKPISNAVNYNVEIDCRNCCASGKWCADVDRIFKHVEALQNTYYKFNFVGAQPGRWRVQAVDNKGIKGRHSQWNYFRFTR